jgi:putative transport protein
MDPEGGRHIVQNLTSPAFAISYPFGLLGVILAMIIVRGLFRLSPTQEAEIAERLERHAKGPAPAVLNIELQNPNLNGLTISRLEDLQRHGVVISRVMHAGKISVARPDVTLQTGDIVLVVGAQTELDAFRIIAGVASTTDLRSAPANITVKELLVTQRDVLGKTVDELNLDGRMGVNITRVRRGPMEFTAVGDFPLQFGDRVVAVGESRALDQAAGELGNSPRDLNHPRLLPIFVGMALGVTVGSIPFTIPGLPVAVKLGLAAGPMIVAIVLARLGRVGRLIWYMPHSASQLVREFGIALFLICVGILAGEGFFATLTKPLGLQLLLLGTLITLLPLLIVGVVARIFLKTNFLHICGILAGSMTSPSLAFTQTMTPSEAPALAFATVYPLTMILRVLMGQLIVLLLP